MKLLESRRDVEDVVPYGINITPCCNRRTVGDACPYKTDDQWSPLRCAVVNLLGNKYSFRHASVPPPSGGRQGRCVEDVAPYDCRLQAVCRLVDRQGCRSLRSVIQYLMQQKRADMESAPTVDKYLPYIDWTGRRGRRPLRCKKMRLVVISGPSGMPVPTERYSIFNATKKGRYGI